MIITMFCLLYSQRTAPIAVIRANNEGEPEETHHPEEEETAISEE